MANARWEEISRLYQAALTRDARERGAFLDEACRGDQVLRREVESLLGYEGEAERLMGAPAVEVAARAMAEKGNRTQTRFGVGASGLELIGRNIGVYKILSRIGAGGMGEVYRARDTKLGRDVAIKILPASFAIDPERVRRFEREARLLAALNHPHIGAIYGFEEANGVRALVLELVEGPTLEELIAGQSIAESGQSSQATAPSRRRGATASGGGPHAV